MVEQRHKLGYVPALDGIRALAILLVVGYHATRLPPGGSLGVDLFFVLSGYLITTILLEERETTGRVSLTRFYARRARRLLPALATLLVGYLLLAGARGNNGIPDVLRGGFYTGNFVRAFDSPDPLASSGIRHLWSLAEEEQFYLIWPLLLLVLVKVRKLALGVALVLVGLIGYRIGMIELTPVNGMHVYYGPDMRADGLVAGAMLAVVARRRELRLPEWAQRLVFCAIAIAVFIPQTGFWWPEFGAPIFELLSVLLIVAATGGGTLAEALSARPLVWIGLISYSLYLWHLPILWALGGQKHRLWPLGVALSFAAAWASWRFVERRFRRPRVSAESPHNANVDDEPEPERRVLEAGLSGLHGEATQSA